MGKTFDDNTKQIFAAHIIASLLSDYLSTQVMQGHFKDSGEATVYGIALTNTLADIGKARREELNCTKLTTEQQKEVQDYVRSLLEKTMNNANQFAEAFSEAAPELYEEFIKEQIDNGSVSDELLKRMQNKLQN